MRLHRFVGCGAEVTLVGDWFDQEFKEWSEKVQEVYIASVPWLRVLSHGVRTDDQILNFVRV